MNAQQTVSEKRKPAKGKPTAVRFSKPIEDLLKRAMKQTGRDKSYLIQQCIIGGLKQYAGKRIQLPESNPL